MVNQFLMAAMNRLSPLIIRRTGPWAAALAASRAGAASKARSRRPGLQDLKLFAVGWLGGLVFFGTLISLRSL